MNNNRKHNWKTKLHEIIYEADTPAGKLFDIILFVFILLSILLVMLESVTDFGLKPDSLFHGFVNLLTPNFYNYAEWFITILFTVEYIARIISVNKPLKYITSFYGIIDLLSTIPKYLSLFLVGTQSLIAFRALRLLRVFRILKLTRYMGASTNFVRALKMSRAKIGVFLLFVIILCIILGTIMYLVENDEGSDFTSIPRSVYWAIVTLTTVGYGDIAPATALGQFIASIIMIMGYAIIAVPTGIVSSEMTKVSNTIQANTQCCVNCLEEKHMDGAEYCFKCGCKLHYD